MYLFYIDSLLLPVSPSKLTININSADETLTLVNETEITFLKNPKLTTIDFEVLVPNAKYPFAHYENGFFTAKTVFDKLENIKKNKKPFEFVVIRNFGKTGQLYSTCMNVSLEGYTISEDKEKLGIDSLVSIKLKQYFDIKTQSVEIEESYTHSTSTAVNSVSTPKPSVSSNCKPQVVVSCNRGASNNAPLPQQGQVHTVVRGESLWEISRKYYGDGSRYMDIYNANKNIISNPSLIYANQVLNIPK